MNPRAPTTDYLRRAVLARLSNPTLSLENEHRHRTLYGPRHLAKNVRLAHQSRSGDVNMQRQPQRQQESLTRQEQRGPAVVGLKFPDRRVAPRPPGAVPGTEAIHGETGKMANGRGGGEGGEGESCGVTIQQLFEESYLPPVVAGPPEPTPDRPQPHSQEQHGNQSYPPLLPDRGPRHVSDVSSNVGGGRKARDVTAASSTSSGLTKLAAIPNKPSSAASSSVDPPLLRPHASSATTTTTSRSSLKSRKWRSDIDSLAPPPRPVTSRSHSRGSSVCAREGGVAVVPQPGLQILKDYSADLTDWERAEIKVFKMVYYLGQMSAKRQARQEAINEGGFDDKEGFYVCKPRDHLLYRYEIVNLLGKGTFGQVVKAWDHKTKSLVALKIVKNERPFLRQAREEVRLLELLSRQDKSDAFNTVHILDSFQFRGHVCIAFELLGISLHQLLKKTRGQGFSLSRVQKLTRGVLRCLDLLSKNRIIHCDIKPENILLRRSAHGHSAAIGTNFSDSSVKVIDFGSSCYEQQQVYTYIQSRYYRAPDVILGQRYSCAIDIWSLACVVAELITSAPLFAGDDEHDQIAAIIELLGLPPEHLAIKCKRWDKFFMGRTPRYLSQSVGRGSPASRTLRDALGHSDDAAFVDFMRRALTWDPTSRLTAAQALRHPWILRGQGCNSAPITRNHVKMAPRTDLAKVKIKTGRGKSTTAVTTTADTITSATTTKTATSTTTKTATSTTNNTNKKKNTTIAQGPTVPSGSVADGRSTQANKKPDTVSSSEIPP